MLFILVLPRYKYFLPRSKLQGSASPVSVLQPRVISLPWAYWKASCKVSSNTNGNCSTRHRSVLSNLDQLRAENQGLEPKTSSSSLLSSATTASESREPDVSIAITRWFIVLYGCKVIFQNVRSCQRKLFALPLRWLLVPSANRGFSKSGSPSILKVVRRPRNVPAVNNGSQSLTFKSTSMNAGRSFGNARNAEKRGHQ